MTDEMHDELQAQIASIVSPDTTKLRYEAIRNFLVTYGKLLPEDQLSPGLIMKNMAKDILEVNEKYEGSFPWACGEVDTPPSVRRAEEDAKAAFTDTEDQPC